MEPSTTVKILHINNMITFPNGAEKEMKEELEKEGIELSVSSWIDPKKRNNLEYPFEKEAVGNAAITTITKDKDLGALYVVSNPHINYFGKTEKGDMLHISSKDTVVTYSTMDGALPWELIPLGTCPLKDLEKNEAHLHICNLFAYLLKLRQCFMSKKPPYKALNHTKKDAHPVYLNKQTNQTFFDEDSLSKIQMFMKKYYGVGIYLGPK